MSSLVGEIENERDTREEEEANFVTKKLPAGLEGRTCVQKFALNGLVWSR